MADTRIYIEQSHYPQSLKFRIKVLKSIAIPIKKGVNCYKKKVKFLTDLRRKELCWI